MRWLLVAVLVAGGCRQVFGIHDPAVSADAAAEVRLDVAPDIAPGSGCYGTPIEICLDHPSLQPISLGTSIVIDTTNSVLCMPFTSPTSPGLDACVIAGSSVAITGGTIAVTGSRPLIAISTGELKLLAGATLDVASHIGGMTGPGANLGCTAATAPSSGASTFGGGAGGSFGGLGGAGGHGGSGGAGGIPAPKLGTAPPGLRGGCGGTTGAGNGGGVGGAGGGAVLVIASTIQIDGTIDASGASGEGGAPGAGGGGGAGSGGMVVFEATTLTISQTGKVFATGGGGGEGSNGSNKGIPGIDPTGPGTPGLGGTGGTANAGDGGNGSYASQLDGVTAGGGVSGGSGGGGGGASGFVLVHAQIIPSVIGLNVAPPVM